MALKLVTHIEDGLGTVAKTIVATTNEDYKLIQAIFQRALNLWPDAPPQLKELGDRVTSGLVYQDYASQDTSKPPKEKSLKVVKCPTCGTDNEIILGTGLTHYKCMNTRCGSINKYSKE